MDLTDTFEKNTTTDAAERWRYPRFFTDNIGDTAVITGDDAKHIATVLRMKAGEPAVLCDGSRQDFLCRISSASKDFVELEVLESRPNEAEPQTEICLYQCMPKSDKMEFIVQKATELGVSRIVPVLSKRCVSRPDEKTAAKKILRYQKIAEEAAKQCGRGRIPQIGETVSFSQAVKAYSADSLGILFYECGGEPLKTLVTPDVKKIDIFIGSEGGFAPEEAELALKSGIHAATLGNRILRCETAPIAALAILMSLTNNM